MKVKELLEKLNALTDEEKELTIVVSDSYLAMFGQISDVTRFDGVTISRILLKSSCK
jgi:hypothetical protein